MNAEKLASPNPSLARAGGEATGPRVRLVLLWSGAAVLLVVGFVAWLLLARSTRESPSVAPSGIKAEGETVEIAPGAPQWRYVDLAVAQEADPLAPVPAPGRIAIDEQRTSSVGAPLAGRVDRVLVRLGDPVKAGTKLFSVRSGALADLKHELEAAKAQVQVKQGLADRTRELVQLKAAPEKDQIAAEAELHEATLALKTAQSRLESLRVAAEGDNLFWVVAPRAGTVVELDVTADQEVTPDRERPLMRISDLDEVLVIADVQETDAADLQVGSAVTVKSQNGQVEKPGTVEHVSEVIDPTRKTVEVRVRAKNEDHKLRANGYVEIGFAPPSATRRIRVPAEAVVTDGQRSVVFVAQADGKLRRMAVQVSRQRDGFAEIASGLKAGERFVAHGALLLQNVIELAD